MTRKKLFSYAFLLLVLLPLLSCDSNGPTSPEGKLVGTRVLTELISVTPSGNQEFTPDEANFHMTLTLESDNTFTSVVTDDEGTMTENDAWSVNGNQITFLSQGRKL